MKRLTGIAMLMVFLLTLGACDPFESQSKPTKTNTISLAKLTEREQGILTTMEHSFVFDFHVGAPYKKVSVWLEKYESGKLVEERINHLTTEVKGSGSIVMTIMNMEGNQKLINTAINNQGGTTTMNNLEKRIQKNSKEEYASVAGTGYSNQTSIKDQMVLASVCYTKNGRSIHTLPSEFYTDMNHHIDELKKYEMVYLLRSEFIK